MQRFAEWSQFCVSTFCRSRVGQARTLDLINSEGR